MIEIPTTLVLGAGSSFPYGLPTGRDLRRIICSELLIERSTIHNAVSAMRHDIGEILAFRNDFFRSQIPSIDEFLANNPHYWDIGKAAIAATLIQQEREDSLLAERDTDHWYRYLWVRLDKSWNGFSANDLRIITFNYDRSLEMYLTVALSSYHTTKELDKAREMIKTMRIMHVYGSLGDLGPYGVGTRPYLPDLTVEAMTVATRSLRVIPEHRDNDKDRELIQKWIRESERICFLGFSYDPINVERLGLRDALPDLDNMFGYPDPAGEFRHGKDVLGTTLGLKSQERVHAARIVKGRLERFRDLACEEFLRAYGVFLK